LVNRPANANCLFPSTPFTGITQPCRLAENTQELW
jgi:hypothetical protein